MRILTQILVLVLMATVSVAQNPVQLSFKEAVQTAIKNNVRLNQEKNQLELNQVQKSSSIGRLAPSVSSSFYAVRIDGNSFNQNEGKVENGVRDNLYGSIDAQITVFNGFNRINAVTQSNASLEAQQYLVKRTEQDVISLVSSQYLQVLLDNELLKISQNNVELQKKQADQIKTQVELGSKAEVDFISQDAQVKSAELSMLRARVTLRNDKATLAQTMLIDPQADFDLDDPSWNTNFTAILDQNLDVLYSNALANRADYMSAIQNEKAARLGVSMAKAGYYPSLAAFGSYGSAYNKLQGSMARPFPDQFFNDNTYFQYGLSLSIPIFNGLQNRVATVRSKVLHDNAVLNKASIENTVKSNVLRSHQNFQDAILAYQSAESQLKAAELSFQLEKERYDLGITDLVQFTQSNQNYVKAQGDFAQAKYTIMFQKILLDYAIGTLRFDDLP